MSQCGIPGKRHAEAGTKSRRWGKMCAMTTNPQRGGAQGWVPEWDLADRLARTLRETGIGVSDMAAQLGVSRETVGRWTNGKGVPKRAGLLAWASVTGVDLEWLETGEGPATSSSPDPDPQLPRLDSNQEPSGYESAQVRGLPRPPAEVVDLAVYRSGRAS